MTNSSLKGKRGERAVARLYREHGFEADREDAQVEAGRQRRFHKKTGRDNRIYLHGKSLPLCIQVKWRDHINVAEAWREALEVAQPDELPIAHVRWTQRTPGEPAVRLVALDERAWVGLLALLRDRGFDLHQLLAEVANADG